MKRIAWLVLLVGCLGFILGGVAAASEVATWEWNGATWTGHNAGDPNAMARAKVSLPQEGACNALDWDIDVKVHASVAQWIDWDMTGTRWDWYVLKPGTYAADCITYTIASNQEVLVTFDGFDDLFAEDDEKAVDDWIEAFYTVGDYDDPPDPGAAWVSAKDMYASSHLFEDSEELHTGIQSKWWIYIVVSNSNSACEYQDHATIRLTLQCQKDWVNDDGTWGTI